MSTQCKSSGSKSVSLSGLAGAVAVAGASQAYGAVVGATLPTNIIGHAPDASSTSRLYWDIDTGVSSTTNFAAADINFGYYNHATAPNEFFTGIYINGGAGTGVVSYYASNATNYTYGLTAGTTVGTGGTYGVFGQKAGFYSIMSLTYAGNTYAIMYPGADYYIGFRFKAADGLLHDGWLKLRSDTYTNPANPGGLKFLGAGYNTTPDSAGGIIPVGQTPEPGSLAALAAGAAALTGIGRGRSRKSGVAASHDQAPLN